MRHTRILLTPLQWAMGYLHSKASSKEESPTKMLPTQALLGHHKWTSQVTTYVAVSVAYCFVAIAVANLIVQLAVVRPQVHGVMVFHTVVCYILAIVYWLAGFHLVHAINPC